MRTVDMQNCMMQNSLHGVQSRHTFQVGALKSLQILLYVEGSCMSLLICSISYEDTDVQSNRIVPLNSRVVNDL